MLTGRQPAFALVHRSHLLDPLDGLSYFSPKSYTDLEQLAAAYSDAFQNSVETFSDSTDPVFKADISLEYLKDLADLAIEISGNFEMLKMNTAKWNSVHPEQAVTIPPHTETDKAVHLGTYINDWTEGQVIAPFAVYMLVP